MNNSQKSQLRQFFSDTFSLPIKTIKDTYYALGVNNANDAYKVLDKEYKKFNTIISSEEKRIQKQQAVEKARDQVKVFLQQNTEKVKQKQVARKEKKLPIQEVSFGITFYLLVIDNEHLEILKNKGIKVIKYNNRYWFKRSRTNGGDTSSYYLEIKTKYPLKYVNELTNFQYVEYPPTDDIQKEKTEKFLRFLKEAIILNSNKDIYDIIEKIIGSYEQTLIEIKNIKYGLPDNETISYEDAFAYDDINSSYISNKYIAFNDEPKINQYVKDNFIEGSCWLNLLVNLFKEPIEKYYKKVKITYQYIHNIISPFRKLLNINNGYSFNEVKLFFEKYMIALVMFDVNFNVVSSYEPNIRNKHINPQIIYVMYHNKHIYHLNHNVKSLEQKLDEYMSKITNICCKPDARYYLKDGDVELKSYIVNNYNELINLMNTCQDEDENIRVLYNKSSCFDLWIECYKNKMEMTTLMTDGEVCFKYLRFMNYKNKNYNIYTLEEEGVYSHKEFDNVEVFNNYMNKRTFATNNLLTINYLSHYSNNVYMMLDKYMKSPLKGNFCDNNLSSYIHVDFNKYYTSIIQSIKQVPIVNSFDDFTNFDNQPIRDYNIYFVEKLNKDNEYPVHKFSLCYGMNIKEVKNIKIIKYLQVSQLKKFYGKEIVKDIYEDKILTPKFKKDIINHIVGKYNKKTNNKYYTSVSTDKLEANVIKQQYGGKLYHQAIRHNSQVYDDDNSLDDEDHADEVLDLYINQVDAETNLTEGFRLLSLLIYDIAYKRLLELKTNIEKCGLKVYGCNTDCLYIENNTEKFEKFVSENEDLFKFEDKNSFDAIGKIKIEYDKSLTYNTHIKKETTNIIDLLDFSLKETNVIPVIDEFNEDELNELIDKNDNLQITAEVAGAGKTSSFINYSIKNNKKMLIVAPYNTLCLDLNIKAKKYNNIFQSITIYKLLGLIYDGNNTKEGTTMDISNFDIVVIDEIYLLNLLDLMRLKHFMEMTFNIKFYATGDEYQNAPIENNLCVDNIKEYFNKIISQMFPNKIILNENKRCKTQEDRQKIKELSNEIRNMNDMSELWNIVKKYKIKITDKIKTKKNVCALNKTCEWLNNKISNIAHKDNKYFIGQELICRKTFKIKSERTFINYTYTITDIKADTYCLTDGFAKIELNKSIVHQHFRLPYARTCHSYQGLTENEPITIFDINSFMVDKYWLYTAITRTTALENVYLFTGQQQTEEHEIKYSINLHQYNDRQRFKIDTFIEDYITYDWIKEQLKINKICKYCKSHFDISDCESFSVDRIDNELPHTKMNCEIICRRCNVSKK
jgi:hypothetical protein